MVLLKQVLGYRGYSCNCLACRWWFRCEKWMLASHSRYFADWPAVFNIRFVSKTVSIQPRYMYKPWNNFNFVGTHKNGLVQHEACKVGGNLLSSNQSIPLEFIDLTSVRTCPLKAGQMSLHDGLLIHGSEPNTSSKRRCGFVIRFVATGAKPIQDPDRPRTFPCTVLVSGKDEYENFEDNKPEWLRELNWTSLAS